MGECSEALRLIGVRDFEGQRLLLFSVLLLSAPIPLSAARYRVSGDVANQHVETTVDSEQAKYYIEHYLAGLCPLPDRSDSMDRTLESLDIDTSDSEALKRLSQRFSTDFATIYFVARLYGDPANGRAQDSFRSYVERLKVSAGVREQLRAHKDDLLAFVPGYAYRKDLTTGADFARQREILGGLGFQTVLIETDELANVEDNAIVVSHELARLVRRYDKIVLVSASKGGPEVALALGERVPEDVRRHVRAWISVGGLLRGSPYADRALRWPRRWFAEIAFLFEGLHPAVIENLSTIVRRPAFTRLRIPSEILTLQYVAAPLSGQVSPSVKGRYEALRSLGPNDGLTLLADELVPGGLVVTDLGLDHYFRDPAIDLKTVALAFVVFDELDRKAGLPAAEVMGVCRPRPRPAWRRN